MKANCEIACGEFFVSITSNILETITHSPAAKLPLSLRSLPVRALYEITRVFLHAGVPLINAQLSPSLDVNNYDSLWKFLRSLPVLQGRPFPQRCSQEAWDSAEEGKFRQGLRAVYMSGSLRFNGSQQPGPFFRFRLEPLKLDSSHRAGRRFGHDRFFEIDIPNLSGRHAPKILQQMGTSGPEIIIGWLVDAYHNFLERVWKPFHIKPKERRDRTSESNQKSSDDPEPVHRIYFFAVDGVGFGDGRIPVDASTQPYTKISVDVLLNRIRPTRKNVKQSYLKLFARTSLGKLHLIHQLALRF